MNQRPFDGGRVVLLIVFVTTAGLYSTAARAQAQPASGGEDTRPLDHALEQLATTAEVNLVYDADLVREHTASCRIRAQAPERTLRCLLDGTGLVAMQTEGGTYVLKERRGPRKSSKGMLRGVVRDASDGRPLSHVHVRTRDGDEGTVSDDEGHFRLSEVPSGDHTFVVHRVGYERKTVRVSVSPGDTLRPTVSLRPSTIVAEPVVVDESPSGVPGPRQSNVLGPDALRQAKGLVGTPSVTETAERLLGISTKAPYSDLYIQGGANTEHTVRLDGAPVRNPASTGRLLSAFSPLALDGLVARKAGFGALRGNALSGVVDLEHRLQRDDGRHAILRADPVSVDGRMEGELTVAGTDITAMGAGRMSLWQLYQPGGLSDLINTWSVLDPALTAAQLSDGDRLPGAGFEGQQTRPTSRFYDLHGAVRVAFSPTKHLYVTGYRGRSELGTDLVTDPPAEEETELVALQTSQRDPVRVPASDQYDWSNTVAQARYETALSPRSTGILQGTFSQYRAVSSFEEGELALSSPTGRPFSDPLDRGTLRGSFTTNRVVEGGLRGGVRVTPSDRDRLSVTTTLRSMHTQFRGGNAFVGRLRHQDQSIRATAAGQWERKVGRHTTVDAGVRLVARPGRGMYAEPRAAVRYQRASTPLGGVKMQLSGGVYRQYTANLELVRDGTTAVVPTAQLWTPVPDAFEPPRSYHLASDLVWAPHSAWTVGVEGYAKWQAHLLETNYPALRERSGTESTDPSVMMAPSEGRAYGGGVRVSYATGGTETTIRYAYSHTRRIFPNRFGGRAVPPPWAEPHRLAVNTRVSLGPIVDVDLQGTGIWGRPWAFRRAYYAYLTPEDVEGAEVDVGINAPESDVLSPLYRLNVGLQAAHDVGGVGVSARVGVVNVLPRTNVADLALRSTPRGTFERRRRTLPDRQLTMSLELRY